MTKKIFLLLGTAILCGILTVAYLNKFASISILYPKGAVECNLFVLILGIMLLTILGTVLIYRANTIELEQKIKKQSRKNEKVSIIKEESEDKVKLLEAKVQTLEKALSEALKGN